MKTLQFLKLEHITTEELASKKYVVMDGGSSGFYAIFCDVYGVPYAYEVTGMLNKYTSGKKMAGHRLASVCKSMEYEEYIMNEENHNIEKFPKIMQRVLMGI